MRVAFASSFFNPAGFARPVRNFKAFLHAIQAHGGVHVVEQVLPGRASQLTEFPQGRESLLLLSGGSVCWQKERLLNALLPSLLNDYDAVCWLDGDLLFPEPRLAERVSRALETADLVQLFSHSFRMAPSWSSRYLGGELVTLAGQSVLGHVAGHCGLSVPASRCDIGLAWGATTEWLRRSGGLFDLGILGGGDSFLVSAATGGDPPGVTEAFDESWRVFRDAIKGTRLGYVPGCAFHLWHGSLGGRRYEDRYEIARRHGLDPAADLRQEGGLWEWASGKPGLHAEVGDYFQGRQEDCDC